MSPPTPTPSHLTNFNPFWFLLTLCLTAQIAWAASKDEWRTRSIYQVMTDRFAPPTETAPALTEGIALGESAVCIDGSQTWCGGNWRSLAEKLDYIKEMGFTALWISPTSLNIDVGTGYGMAYHGYWVQDPTRLNPRFGTSDDLKYLSAELHKRDMFLMVDIVVNNVVATPGANVTQMVKDDPNILWRDDDMFHPECWIDYNNASSVEQCWLGDEKLPLPDVNTENPTVIAALQTWIKQFVQDYSVDGLRIDAAKHVRGDFWKPFCASAGVFCIGEVYTDSVNVAASYQALGNLDSVLNFPVYYGVADAFFPTPGTTLNMSSLVETYSAAQQAFPDIGVLGNFLGNHDLPRYHGLQVDPRTNWNALVWQFMSDGIPITFYGDEQEIGQAHPGSGDPFNRPAMWVPGSGNYSTSSGTFQNIKRLNQIRNYLLTSGSQYNGKTFFQSNLQVLANSSNDLAFRKGPAIVVVTNRGSPSQDASVGIVKTSFTGSVINMLECTSTAIGSDGSLAVSYAAPGVGGKPYVFFSYADAAASKLCPNIVADNTTSVPRKNNRAASAASRTHESSNVYLGCFMMAVMACTLFLQT